MESNLWKEADRRQFFKVCCNLNAFTSVKITWISRTGVFTTHNDNRQTQPISLHLVHVYWVIIVVTFSTIWQWCEHNEIVNSWNMLGFQSLFHKRGWMSNSSMQRNREYVRKWFLVLSNSNADGGLETLCFQKPVTIFWPYWQSVIFYYDNFCAADHSLTQHDELC